MTETEAIKALGKKIAEHYERGERDELQSALIDLANLVGAQDKFKPQYRRKQ